MVGVNGFEQDKPARNEAEWLGTGKDKPGRPGSDVTGCCRIERDGTRRDKPELDGTG